MPESFLHRCGGFLTKKKDSTRSIETPQYHMHWLLTKIQNGTIVYNILEVLYAMSFTMQAKHATSNNYDTTNMVLLLLSQSWALVEDTRYSSIREALLSYAERVVKIQKECLYCCFLCWMRTGGLLEIWWCWRWWLYHIIRSMFWECFLKCWTCMNWAGMTLRCNSKQSNQNNLLEAVWRGILTWQKENWKRASSGTYLLPSRSNTFYLGSQSCGQQRCDERLQMRCVHSFQIDSLWMYTRGNCWWSI